MPGIDNDLIIGHDGQGNPVLAPKRKKSGGGAMIYARYELLPTNNNDTVVWNRSVCQGRVQISGFQVPGMLVIGVYNSIFNLCRIDNHKLMFNELSDVIGQAKKKDPSCNIILCGDWNCPTLVNPAYFEVSGITTGTEDSIEAQYGEFLRAHDLVVANSDFTRGDKVLDIFFVSRDVMSHEQTSTNTEDDFYNMNKENFRFKFDHKVVSLLTPMLRFENIVTEKMKLFPRTFDTMKAMESLRRSKLLDNISYGSTREEIEKTHSQLVEALQSLQDSCCEKRLIKIGRSRRQFLNDQRSSNVKNVLRKMKRKLRITPRNSTLAETIRKKMSEVSETEDDRIMSKAMNECRHNPTKLAKFIKGDNPKGCPPLKLDGRVIYDGKEKADILIKQFTKAMTKRSDIGARPAKKTGDMEDIRVTNDMVEASIDSINALSAPGPDGIHPVVIKRLKSVLIPVVKKKLQMQLDGGYVPIGNKMADIVPISKKANSSDPANQRPVQKTNILAKIDESIVMDQMDKYRKMNNKVQYNQHGFTKWRSTGTIQLKFWSTIDNILNNPKNNRCVHVALIDFSKAFDAISWEWILRSLAGSGINHNNASIWYRNFLRVEGDRTIRVQVEDKFSEKSICSSGGTQGSRSAPRAFNIAVEPLIRKILGLNENPEYQNCNKIEALMYADDLKVMIYAKTEKDQEKLQKAIDMIMEFCNEAKMSMNVGKSCIMKIRRKKSSFVDDWTYTAGNQQLKEVDTYNDLGQWITNTRDTKLHWQKIENKINATCAIVKKNMWRPSQKVITTIYKAYLVPLVTLAAATAWRCPNYLHPNREGTDSNYESTLLIKLTKRVFSLAPFKAGIDSNFDLVQHCVIAWMKNINRMYYAPREEGLVNFDDAWSHGNLRARIQPKIPTRHCANDGRFLEDAHHFWNRIGEDIINMNLSYISDPKLKRKRRAKKIVRFFLGYFGIVDFEKARDMAKDREREYKREQERIRNRENRERQVANVTRGTNGDDL